MEHTIIIWEKLKERNENGEYNFRIASRYTLTEEEIEAQETAKWNSDEDPDSKWEYYAEIEETRH